MVNENGVMHYRCNSSTPTQESFQKNTVSRGITAIALVSCAVMSVGCTDVRQEKSTSNFKYFDCISPDFIDHSISKNGSLDTDSKDNKITIAVIDKGIPDWNFKNNIQSDTSSTFIKSPNYKYYTSPNDKNHGIICASVVSMIADKDMVKCISHPEVNNIDTSLIEDAGKNARIISLSIGERNINNDHEIVKAIDGIMINPHKRPLILIAAGNDGASKDEKINKIQENDLNNILRNKYPEDVIVVGSMNIRNERSSFSTKGADLYVLGECVPSMNTHRKYIFSEGTSVATPKAAVLVAEFMYKNPGHSNAYYKNAMMSHDNPIVKEGYQEKSMTLNADIVEK